MNTANRPSVEAVVVPDDEIMDCMEDAGWHCEIRHGWWHPPSCVAAWPFEEAKLMFLRDEEQRRHNDTLQGSPGAQRKEIP